MFKILVGMSLITVVAEMFLSGSKFKKYVKSVVGIFAFLIIIEGVFSLEYKGLDDDLIKKAESIAQDVITKSEENIMDTFKNNIKNTLLNENIEVIRLDIRYDKNLVIKKISIKLKNRKDEKKAEEILLNNFGIDFNLINITYQEEDNNGDF